MPSSVVAEVEAEVVKVQEKNIGSYCENISTARVHANKNNQGETTKVCSPNHVFHSVQLTSTANFAV